MKISPAALPFLILAAALGPPAHASLLQRSRGRGGHHRGGCCLSFTPHNIRCELMKDYRETHQQCFQPGIVFTTKKGQEVCADPYNKKVKDCMEDLDSAKKQRKKVG